MQCQGREAEPKNLRVTLLPGSQWSPSRARERDPRLQGMANTLQIAAFTGQQKQLCIQMFDVYEMNH